MATGKKKGKYQCLITEHELNPTVMVLVRGAEVTEPLKYLLVKLNNAIDRNSNTRLAGFAISLGFVVSGSIVMEEVFSYPGIGFKLLDAVQNDDYPLMQGIFLVITFAVLGANLVVDLLYGFIDPRTRAAR